jgi:hypothetical protein
MRDLATVGGGTYEQGTYLPFTPKDGFAVAFNGGVKATVGQVTLGWLERWLKAVPTEFEASFVGTWADGDTHDLSTVVYLDAVRYIRNRDEAIAFGVAQRQLAIWDFAAGESITLPQEA